MIIHLTRRTRSAILAATTFLYVFTVLGGVGFAAPKSAAILEDLVPPLTDADTNPRTRIIGWEQECTNELNAERAGGGPARSIVNAAAYNQKFWLSRAGDPSMKISSTLAPTTTSIDLQINQVLFLCAIVTMTDSGSTFPLAVNQVSNGRYPNERGPVPDDPDYNPNMASRYENNTHIYSIAASSGGSITGGAGEEFGYRRDNASRYWFANVRPFTYNLSPALRTPGTHTITVTASVANISTYHNFGSAGENICVLRSTGSSGVVPYDRFDLCERFDRSYSFTYTIADPVTVSCVPGNGVTVTSANQEVGMPMTFIMRVNSSGSTPPPPRNFAYTVRAPGGAVVQSGNVGSGGNPRISSAVTHTPATGGTYNVTWSYIAGGVTEASGCTGSFTIANKPYFVVSAGDISAGAITSAAGAETSDNTAGIESWNFDNNTAGGQSGWYGAGVRAAAYALGDIKSFASGQNPLGNSLLLAGRTANGSLQATKAGPTPHDYSFANSGAVPVDNVGNYGGRFGKLPFPFNYAGSVTSGNPTWTNDYTTSATYNVTGTTVLNGGMLGLDALGRGVVVTVKVNGDVYIADNIFYNTTAGPTRYPRLNVFATGNIYVSGAVTELHGMFAAQDGRFATCANMSGGIITETTSYNSCNNKLTVYGAVVAKQFDLNRSYGTLSSPRVGGGVAGPAEDFVYGPEFWLATSSCSVNPDDEICTGASSAYDTLTSLPPVL